VDVNTTVEQILTLVTPTKLKREHSWSPPDMDTTALHSLDPGPFTTYDFDRGPVAAIGTEYTRAGSVSETEQSPKSMRSHSDFSILRDEDGLW
jgi:hypothetical protein